MSLAGNCNEGSPPVGISRRQFLRAIGGGFVTAATVIAAGCAPLQSPALAQEPIVAATVTPAAVPTTPGATNRATLRFWTQWSGHTRQVWQSLAEEFQRTHPTIVIASSFFTLADLQRAVLTATTTGTLPDLWINAALVQPELILDGVVTSLNSLGPVPTDFYPVADQASVRSGQRWAVPNNGGVPVIWYNVDQFKTAGLDPNRPPQTWDDLQRYGKELTNSSQGTWGLIVPNRHYPWTAECWYGFLLEAGGDILTPNQQSVAFNDQPGVEALTFWADLFQTQKTAPLEDFDADSLISTYGAGNIGMFPMYSIETARIKRFPFPSQNTTFPKYRQRGAHFAGSYTTISAKSRNKAEAYTWCSWWWQPPINATWCAGTGGIPARVSATADPIYQNFVKQEPLIKASLETIPFAKAMPSRPGILEIEQRLSEAIYYACFGYKTPKQALDDAVPAVHSILAQSGRWRSWDQG